MRCLVLFTTLLFAVIGATATADLTSGPCDAPLGIVCRLGNGATTPGGASNNKASHAGWPRVTGVYWVLPASGGGGKATRFNDELLGNHGDDTLNGGPGKDIIWGDMLPTGNTTRQHDVLLGGSGNDFIYASHGHNVIEAGAGNDVVHAHYGRGIVDCGRGNDLVYVSHKRRKGWKLRHCERVTFHAGLTPLSSRG